MLVDLEELPAVDDGLEDGTQPCQVQTGSASSADPKYDQFDEHDIDDIDVTVYDDDAVHRAYLPLVTRKWPPVPDAPTLYAIDNQDGDGTYSIHWSQGAEVQVYILEESTDSAFSDVRATYSTGSTEYEITGQGPARLYYRVKARNSWGDSGWSTVQQVDVLWELEPNDLASQAAGPIVSASGADAGLTYFGTFPSASDEKDYFTFDLASPNRVELWLANIAPGQNYDLVLRCPSGPSGILGRTEQ